MPKCFAENSTWVCAWDRSATSSRWLLTVQPLNTSDCGVQDDSEVGNRHSPVVAAYAHAVILQNRADSLGRLSIGDMDEKKRVTLSRELHKLLRKVVIIAEQRSQPAENAAPPFEFLSCLNDEGRVEDVYVSRGQPQASQRVDYGL